MVVDDIPYREGAFIYGTSTWNPSAGVLSGSLSLKLRAGLHHVKLQWRRTGDIFKAWTSTPSTLDGFAVSRNVYVMSENYNAPSDASQSRQRLVGNDKWHTIGDALAMNLIKESDVKIKYRWHVTERQTKK